MFKTNPPKDLLRKSIDAQAIRGRFEDSYDEVVYFGLPGPAMLDVKEWKDDLDFVIAVENKQEMIGMMEVTATSLGLGDSVQVLLGDIETVLLNWEDENGEMPSKDFFHVVNLDFEGGFIGFSDIKRNDRRTDAIRELFRHQKDQGESFILFLTVGFREKRHQEYDQKLHHIGEELASLGLNATETIKWYLSHSTRYKLKVYIPYLIDEIGRVNRYRLEKYLCFYYKGAGNVPMMHFIFDMQYLEGSISPRRLSLKSLLDTPLFISFGDRVEPCQFHPPPIEKG